MISFLMPFTDLSENNETDEHYGDCGGAKNDSICKDEVELRFWFDPDNRTCKSYKYGGCDPNSNTFRTKLECLLECAEFIENRCALPIDEGDCMDGSETRFGYNRVFHSCEEFKYTGCGGNRNNFKTAKECWTTFARALHIVLNAYENIC
ncbi:hypothetical protein HPB49_024519 [Dermacentor silvarum]|uniref:Uncharacterized protein n=1 Tax=Dermacentor silvarum TaxID=543639 RepID=A0ACB8CI68_DERSI|nr:hypothetical protein HPB49_024519 [Dermacentor silvarum]